MKPCLCNQLVLLRYIPYVKNPRKITKYRPISLCNVIYKLAFKTVANRLKTVLSSIVNENQSAFTKGRFITDNILVSYETMHYISYKRTGKIGEMALKLDMSKAYDRMEWACLRGIMEKLGIHRRMVEVVMRCVCTITYSVRINGKPTGRITPSRGLRQGDPLSPCLFLLYAEGLSGLIRQQVDKGNLKGVAICRGAPHISHLFFTDDSLIFCQATLGECEVLQQIFLVYEVVSGQQLNRNKSALFFSKNTPSAIQEEIQRRFRAW